MSAKNKCCRQLAYDCLEKIIVSGLSEFNQFNLRILKVNTINAQNPYEKIGFLVSTE